MKMIKCLLIMLVSITVAACGGGGSIPIGDGAGGVITLTPTVPSAPTIGSATAGNVQATVSFTDPVSNGGAAITGYTVIPNPPVGVDNHAGSTNLTHIIVGLTNGTAYTFTVTATNSVGTSQASAASNSVTPATPPLSATVPGAPTIGIATAGNAQASVTFTAPSSDGGSAITSYTATCGAISGIGIVSPMVVTGLTNGTAYTCIVTATNAFGTGAPSAVSNSVTPVVPPANALSTLNDTGQTLCYNSTLEIACANTGTHPRQDAFFGRDANTTVLTKIGAGAAGFDFTKVCMSGALAGVGACVSPLAAADQAVPVANEWACTKDNHTKLIWSLQGGADHWNNATDPNNGAAVANHARAANTAIRCGFNTGWRLPTRRELLSIVHNGTLNPSIDTNYFPDTLSDFYWSTDTYAPFPTKAWLVNFSVGSTQANDKIDSIVQVRLVRSGQ